jgi:hypothetical protein
VSFVTLNTECPVTPTNTGTALSGGRVRKKVGQKIINDDLGSRPVINTDGISTSSILLRVENKSSAKIILPHIIRSTSKISQLFTKGYSLSKLIHVEKFTSMSKIRLFVRNESKSYPDIESLKVKIAGEMEARKITRIEKLKRTLRLQEIHSKLEFLDGIDDMFDVKPVILSFEFEETVHNEQLIAFTHTSSWIGNVRFNTDTLEMRILMNGKAYNFCGVPRRVYDAFEGSPSKGEFYWRELRQLYSC